ncbi:unnamed protein product [Ectocarpus sp. CCAP 1310/34]|nr:unnamed protein product [Ectocarpus sp. CCAP 1310/34]
MQLGFKAAETAGQHWSESCRRWIKGVPQADAKQRQR